LAHNAGVFGNGILPLYNILYAILHLNCTNKRGFCKLVLKNLQNIAHYVDNPVIK